MMDNQVIKLFPCETGTVFAVGHIDKAEFLLAASASRECMVEDFTQDDVEYRWLKFIEPHHEQDFRVQYLEGDCDPAAIPVTGIFA